MIKDVGKYFVSLNDDINHTIRILNDGKAQVALVVDHKKSLVGIVTDGDIRRAFLNGKNLNDCVSDVMTTNPITLLNGATEVDAVEKVKQNLIHHVPILNNLGQVVEMFVLDEYLQAPCRPNHVVIMAGGKGERLKPLTNNCPKPMLHVGDKPILELILKQCIEAGLKKFYFSVNYLKDQIIEYFGDGSKWGVNINYLEENIPLGTAGSLSLITDIPKHDLMVLNGDVMTNLDFDRLFKFHNKLQSDITICTKNHKVSIPFAVLKTDGSIVSDLSEKPTYNYQVNAGVYLMKSSHIDAVPNSLFNMTDLIDYLIRLECKVNAFPIHESWNDIGNPNDLEFCRQILIKAHI